MESPADVGLYCIGGVLAGYSKLSNTTKSCERIHGDPRCPDCSCCLWHLRASWGHHFPVALTIGRSGELVAEHLPVVVEGDPVQYQINRNRQGWVIELVHNGGVVKKLDQPAVVDPQAVAHVRVRPRVAIREARVWGGNQQLPRSQAFSVTVPPGQSVFIELVLQEP